MQKLVKMFEDLMVAVTFAEASEFDEAHKIMGHEAEHDAEAQAAGSKVLKGTS